MGDPTAKNMGRLTLNPIKHMDPIGTVVLPLLLVITGSGFLGWAKPVPYNPYNLSDQKWGNTKVAFSGPAANFLLALIFAVVLRFTDLEIRLDAAISWIIFLNIYLGLFNLIPIPPLDGSKLLMDLFPSTRQYLAQLSVFGIILAIFVAFIILPDLSDLIYRLFVGDIFVFPRLF